MEVTNLIAANVKGIRERKKLTLDAAAAATGVSRSMLAQIEKGEVNPTISVLWKIANGYKVSFTSLLESGGDSVSVARQGEIQPLSEDEGRYVNYPIFAFNEKTLFETYRIVIRPGGFLAAQPYLTGRRNTSPSFAARWRSPLQTSGICSGKATLSAFWRTFPMPTAMRGRRRRS